MTAQMRKFGSRMVLLFFLSISLAGAVMTWWSFLSSPHWKALLSSPPESAPEVTLLANRPVPAPEKVLAKLPEATSPLALKLLAILKSSKDQSLAVIQDLGLEKSNLYAVGDKLPYEAALLNIASDRVSVRRKDGETEVLHLDSDDNTLMVKGLLITKLSDTEWLVSRNDLREAAVHTLIELAQVEVKPKVAEGRLQGFSVRGVAEEGILGAMGLKEGDLIGEIDSQPLENYRKASSLLGDAFQKSSFTLTIVKKTDRKTHTYYLSP